MNARDVACDVLEAVRLRDAYANLELPGTLRRARLSASDAGFATELTYGTLRMLGQYDSVIEKAAGRPVADIDPRVLDILRVGTHQWIALATPAHAVVDESAQLARRRTSRGSVGFVNAVMRRVTEKSSDEWVAEVTEGLNEDDTLAVSSSHPAWIVRALRSSLKHEGLESELSDLLVADNLAPRVTLARLRGAEAITNTEPGLFSRRARVMSTGGDPSLNEAVKAGDARVQDEGSQLAALVLVGAQPLIAGEKWLDLCAGPGGKTALLAAETSATDVRIVANEIAPHRVNLVQSAVSGFSNVDVEVGDGRRYGAEQPNTFDRILVDAPCSGLGALRRRPESRWRRTTKDVATLTGIQWDLLQSGLAALKPGGVLVYVTCSPHLVETRAIVDRAVRENPAVRELDTKAALRRLTISPLKLAGPDQSVQLWPHRHGTDAMFIALLTK